MCAVDLFPIPEWVWENSLSSSSTCGSHSVTSQTIRPAVLAGNLEDAIHYVDGYPITESSKATEVIFGEKVAEPHLIDYEGGKAVMFVFQERMFST